ncbi:hypothetical protein [Raineyella antarctica]|uniref:hypothetical protein n=1 Tax=Raineyella antarctica TaxID=1577474 RepID=UPI001114874F|nr:hypothetical protein [Raineyella antarctica]
MIIVAITMVLGTVMVMNPQCRTWMSSGTRELMKGELVKGMEVPPSLLRSVSSDGMVKEAPDLDRKANVAPWQERFPANG